MCPYNKNKTKIGISKSFRSILYMPSISINTKFNFTYLSKFCVGRRRKRKGEREFCQAKVNHFVVVKNAKVLRNKVFFFFSTILDYFLGNGPLVSRKIVFDSLGQLEIKR